MVGAQADGLSLSDSCAHLRSSGAGPESWKAPPSRSLSSGSTEGVNTYGCKACPDAWLASSSSSVSAPSGLPHLLKNSCRIRSRQH